MYITSLNDRAITFNDLEKKIYNLNKLSKMRELVKNKIQEYMNEIEVNDELD